MYVNILPVSMSTPQPTDMCISLCSFHQHELLALTAQSKHIILTSHSNSERPYLSHVLKERLEKEMKEESGDDWAVCVSERDRDPLVVV